MEFLACVCVCENVYVNGCACVLINPLNAELNPICHLLALVVAHHILHVSGIRVKGAIKTKRVQGVNDRIIYNS